MAVNRQVSASPRAYARPRRPFDGGMTGNERLTGATGGVLIVLLAILGVVVLSTVAVFASGVALLFGRAGRVLSLASALVLGLVLAILALPEFGPWLSAHH